MTTTTFNQAMPPEVVLNLLGEDGSMISYRPRLNAITGSVTATILLSQIVWRWTKNGGEKFYKFKEPCGHDHYREGDSWCEELGFTRTEFDTALKRFAVKATSIDDANAKNPNAFVYYHTDRNRVTWYAVNPAPLVKAVNQLYLNQDSCFRKSGIPTLPLTETTAEISKSHSPPSGSDREGRVEPTQGQETQTPSRTCPDAGKGQEPGKAAPRQGQTPTFPSLPVPDPPSCAKVPAATKTTAKGRFSERVRAIAAYVLELTLSRKKITITPAKTAATRDAIDKMIRLDGITPDRIERALHWFSGHMDDDYALVIESGTALRRKFTRLEAWIERHNRNGNGHRKQIKSARSAW